MSRSFADSASETYNIDQNLNEKGTKQELVEVEVQTGSEFLPKKVDVETTTFSSRKDQATAPLNLKMELIEANPIDLVKFLKRVQPLMLRELQPKAAYNFMKTKSNMGHLEIVSQVDTDSQYTVTQLSTNCTGSTVAVSLEMQNHFGFCKHSSQLFFVPTTGGNVHTYQLESCATCIRYHPHYPAIIAIGHHTGEISIIRSEEPWAHSQLGEQHIDKIVALDWISEHQVVRALVSASIGGLICVWTLKGRNTHTKVLEKVQSMKVFDKDGAITSLTVIPGTCDALVGLMSGQIVRVPLPYESSLVAHERQFYSGHVGPVMAIAVCPIAPGLFISAGTDEMLLIRNAVCNNPLISMELNGKALTDVKWSPHSPSIVAVAGEDKVAVIDLSVTTSGPILSADVHGAFRVSWNEAIPDMLIVGCTDGKIVILSCKDGSLDQKPGSNKIVTELEAQTKIGISK